MLYTYELVIEPLSFVSLHFMIHEPHKLKCSEHLTIIRIDPNKK